MGGANQGNSCLCGDELTNAENAPSRPAQAPTASSVASKYVTSVFCPKMSFSVRV